MGMLYRRGTIWWAKYYINGRPVRESSRTDKESEAKRFLKEREGRVATGQPIIRRADRVRYEEIAADLRRHYETTGVRNLREADTRLKNLSHFFRQRRVVDLTPDLVTKYVQARQARGKANGTINRELATLIKMLRLAFEQEKLVRLPVIRKLKEAAPRQGFFEREPFLAVCRQLPDDVRAAVCISYEFGWRMQSEVLTLRLSQVDLEAGTLRLEPGTTKNEEGRLVYMTPELRALIVAQVGRVKAVGRRIERVVPYLFPHLHGPSKGQRLKNIRRTWNSACRDAGVPGMRKHDLRRTAVRNLVNRGVPERVAMMVTGHRTRAVFDRYHIVSPQDLQDAAKKLAGTIPGTLAESALTLPR